MQGIGYGNSQYFNPRQVGGLKVWVDANDPSANGTQPSNGSTIATFSDKSPAANNFVQATSILRPTYSTNTLNGKPTLTFAGTQYLTGATTSNILYSAFVVGKTTITSTVQSYFGNGTVGSDGQSMLAITGPSKKFGMLYGGSSWHEDGNPDTNYHVFNGLWNGSVSLFYVDNISQPIDNDTFAPITGTGASSIGANNSGSSGLIGNVAEILFFDNQLVDPSKKNVIYNYLKNKWGL